MEPFDISSDSHDTTEEYLLCPTCYRSITSTLRDLTIEHAIAYLKMDFCGKMVSPVVHSSSPVQ